MSDVAIQEKTFEDFWIASSLNYLSKNKESPPELVFKQLPAGTNQ